ncbi:unnamed protein product [Aphanomyces euteiches]|uniref:Uncharacterized protein n=1 Tax=Aphanomyces euteiches TaxID=100861 RepID=A0A6G0WRD5_9STRA|nr:hypothetical protein Ae201684_012481 [Aphanomyces euteiches]KAH9090608.1 hypothetical protein Ae201684P_014404 [Aphanomyces euteiches]KAH9139394.1 hypothetical protein AeRB84_016342 [Aphanomyces euteiches]
MAEATPFWRPKSYEDNPYAYAIFDTPYSLNELKYMDILCQVLAKPSWWIKMNDATILAKWKAESQLSDNDFAFLEAELKDIAATWKLSDPTSAGTVPSPVCGVFTTDKLKQSTLHQAIRSAAVKLEEEARTRGDFHPGSNKQVLDIVHPSLYCAVNGRTQISQTVNALVGDEVLNWPKIGAYDISDKFQWLPTPVKVDDEGKASFGSYVNNIHPTDHAGMYTALESLFSTMLPLFERTLGSNDVVPNLRIKIRSWYDIMPLGRYESARAKWAEMTKDVPAEETKTEEFQARRNDFFANFTDKDVVLNIPQLPSSFDYQQEYPRRPLSGKNLQVIVKIASIELTPDNPKYAGGSWHVEGMTNESIAATGILYYDCENITTSKLAFRHVFDSQYIDSVGYEQDEHAAITGVYGITREGHENLQVVGHVQAEVGRIVVFPNCLQHCVAPFELADPTKPGHRKIVCFFLVNPDNSILSTANVPPQQATWSLRSMEKALSSKLPDVALQSVQDLSGMMTHDEAKKHMEDLMEERKKSSVFAQYLTSEISLCEH